MKLRIFNSLKSSFPILMGRRQVAICIAALAFSGSLYFGSSTNAKVREQAFASEPSLRSQTVSRIEYVSFGHREIGGVLVALGFLKNLSIAWQLKTNGVPVSHLDISGISSLIQGRRGYSHLAERAVSFLTLDIGAFEEAIALASLIRVTTAADEKHLDAYFRASLALAFIFHYFTHELDKAGEIYIELSTFRPQASWLKSLGNQLILAHQSPHLSAPELPHNVLLALCKQFQFSSFRNKETNEETLRQRVCKALDE